eukprot:5442061-Pyramimonas_sp.AAC.1
MAGRPFSIGVRLNSSPGGAWGFGERDRLRELPLGWGEQEEEEEEEECDRDVAKAAGRKDGGEEEGPKKS